MRKRTNRRVRPSLLPLAMKNRMKTELPVLMALASVGTDWLTEGLLDELFNLGLIAYKSGEDDIKRGGWLLVQACTRVKDRLERLGKLGCNGDERGVIIQVVPRLSEWFQSQPNTKLIRILEDIENGR